MHTRTATIHLKPSPNKLQGPLCRPKSGLHHFALVRLSWCGTLWCTRRLLGVRLAILTGRAPGESKRVAFVARGCMHMPPFMDPA